MGKKLILALLLVLVVSQPVMAGGYPDTYGLSARAIAMGGAFTAVADNYAAAYYNPAGLSQKSGDEFTFDFLYTHPDITVKKASGGDLVIMGADGEVRNDPTKMAIQTENLDLMIPQIGLQIDMNRIVKMPLHTSLGLAISFPEQFDIAYRVNDYPPDQPHLIRYGDNVDRVTIVGGLGVELMRNMLHVGVGVQAMLYGPGGFYINTAGTEPGPVNSQAEFGAILNYDPIIGILMLPTEKIKIGVNWRRAQELNVGPLNANVAMNIGGIAMDIPMAVDIRCFYTPDEWSLGMAYDGDNFLVSLQVDRQLWSDYEMSHSDAYHYTQKPDFKDTYNYRAGVEWKLSKDFTLMAGYYRQPSPVPNQSGMVNNYIDMDKDVFSLGYTWTWRTGLLRDMMFLIKPPLKWTAAIQYQKMDSYSVDKTGVTGISWANQESYKVEGSALSGTIGVSLSF